MSDRYHVGSHHRFLVTRQHAALMRDEVCGRTGGAGVTLDFSGVEAITGAFGDELLYGVARVGKRLVPVLVEGANEDVREVLELVVERRGLSSVTFSDSPPSEHLPEIDTTEDEFDRMMAEGQSVELEER